MLDGVNISETRWKIKREVFQGNPQYCLLKASTVDYKGFGLIKCATAHMTIGVLSKDNQKYGNINQMGLENTVRMPFTASTN